MKWSCSVMPYFLRPHGTVAYQAPHSMEFSRQEYWSGLSCPSPGHLPYPGIEPGCPTLQADALPSEPPRKPREDIYSPLKWVSEVAQSCPTLCDPMDCSLPGSIHEIFQARILEWVAISFSRRSSRPRDRTWVSRIAGRRFTVWATREAHIALKEKLIVLNFI